MQHDGEHAPRGLDSLQRWFLRVVTDPDGVEAGAASEDARALFGGGVGAVLRPSTRLSAEARLGVYADAYFARLVQCLEEQYPGLVRCLGKETFAGFALDYLVARPSRSYSLNGLGAGLAAHLARTRPPRESAAPDWADFLVELAEFEWTLLEVFDGPGLEERERLTPESLRAIPPERASELAFELDPSLRLRRFRFPLDATYRTLRDESDESAFAPPEPREELVLFHRRDYRVRRMVLEPAPFRLLEALAAGAALGEALAAAFAGSSATEMDLRASLERWFAEWTEEGLFAAARDGAGAARHSGAG